MHLPRRTLATVLLLTNTVCWGAALPVVKPALDLTTPFQHLFTRYVIACFLTLPLLAWYLWKQPGLIKSIPMIIGLEIIGTVAALGLLYEGLSRTSALDAGIIVTTAPVFIVLGGILFLHEKQKMNEWIGLFMSLFGTLILTLYSGLDDWRAGIPFLFTGSILLVLQNVAEAGFFLTAKRRYASLPKLFVTAVSFWVGLIGFALLGMLKLKLGPTAFALDTWQDFQQPSAIFAATYMAIFGSIIGLTTYIAGQNLIEASEASIFRYLQPLVYIPLAIFLLGEKFNVVTITALAFIALGVYLAEYRKTRAKKARQVSRAGKIRSKQTA